MGTIWILVVFWLGPAPVEHPQPTFGAQLFDTLEACEKRARSLAAAFDGEGYPDGLRAISDCRPEPEVEVSDGRPHANDGDVRVRP